MLMDREGLWFRVLAARDGGGGWFGECITKKVGDGVETFFWTDPWVAGIPLCERFGRLFDLAENKSASVAEMFSLGWQWQPDLDSGYTVRGAYHLLTEQEAVPLDGVAGLIWHPHVPLKVSSHAWRLLRDRLPTKVNLIIRGILPLAEQLCVSDCSEVETAQHLFLSCSMFGSIWSLVSSWIGTPLVTAQTLSDHFVQFTSSAGGSRGRRSFMQLI
ncbi:hypothetical protein TSUD_30050 [Trifolium subterraneum]|uniref:Reverse transcriptase zinc-binding domain-containing protein n=1 Tax=Trifolium subterraneum TaxID=3900 RepID=A0A2Z6MBV2_TRISU|nr:hypothetical protein TSUD_30050 [Trifolium subterraneum]